MAVSLRCVNGGTPFEVTKDDFTVGVMKTLMRAQIKAQAEYEGSPDGQALAILEAFLPVMQKIAAKQDATWKARPVEDFEDALSIEELKTYMEVVAEVIPKAGGEVAAPLV